MASWIGTKARWTRRNDPRKERCWHAVAFNEVFLAICQCGNGPITCQTLSQESEQHLLIPPTTLNSNPNQIRTCQSTVFQIRSLSLLENKTADPAGRHFKSNCEISNNNIWHASAFDTITQAAFSHSLKHSQKQILSGGINR